MCMYVFCQKGTASVSCGSCSESESFFMFCLFGVLLWIVIGDYGSVTSTACNLTTVPLRPKVTIER